MPQLRGNGPILGLNNRDNILQLCRSSYWSNPVIKKLNRQA
jgi:hypothetical protein